MKKEKKKGLKFTCPKAISFRALSDVLPSMEACLVAKGLKVLHDLPHILDRHDDEGGDTEHQEVTESGRTARHCQAQELSPGTGKHITYLMNNIQGLSKLLS